MRKSIVINRILIGIMILGTLASIVFSIVLVQTDRLLTQVAIFPVLLIPNLLNKMKLHFNAVMQTYFYVFIFLAQFLGCVLNFYGIFTYFDVFVHFLSGIASSFLAIYLLEIAKQKNHSILIDILFILGITCLCAVVWEIYEFGCDSLLGMNVQHAIETGVVDTMEDMIAAFLGSLLFCLLYIVEITKSQNGIIQTFRNQVNQWKTPHGIN